MEKNKNGARLEFWCRIFSIEFMKTELQIFALFIAALCAGCGGIPTRLDMSDASKSEVRKIAIVQVLPSQFVTVMNSNIGVKMFGGVIPQAISQNSIQTKTQGYAAGLNQRKTTFAPELAATLKAALIKNGYEVEYLDAQPLVRREDKTLDFAAVKTDADAILQVNYGSVGYLSPDFDNSYTPIVNLGVIMVNAKTQKYLFVRQLSASAMAEQAQYSTLPTKPISIMPAREYRYPTYEDLMARFDNSVEGIMATQQLLVDQIAAQVAKSQRMQASAAGAPAKQ